MSSINKIPVKDSQFKKYKKWVEQTQGKDIQEYLALHITQKLESLRKQNGRCEQRSIFLHKGKFKGSCRWNSWKNCYEIYLRTDEKQCSYGFFSNLFSAETELKQLFKYDERDMLKRARKQQKYYQKQHRLLTRPRITDKMNKFKSCTTGNKTGIHLLCIDTFVNPVTNKQQKNIWFSPKLLKYYNKKQILEEIISMDNPIEIIKYREDLKQRIKKLKNSKK